MVNTPEAMAARIVRREGGFVNDADDPGGATKYGVTIGTMQRLGLDLDGDGDIDIDDVKALTVDEATKIYLDQYFRVPKIHALPKSIQPTVFDQYVHSGSGAITLLQATLNTIDPQAEGLAVDGVLGRFSIGAAFRAEAVIGSVALCDIYSIERRIRYFRLADKRVRSRKYCVTQAGGKGGWIKRAEDFISHFFHMSDEEFTARVAAWSP